MDLLGVPNKQRAAVAMSVGLAEIK